MRYRDFQGGLQVSEITFGAMRFVPKTRDDDDRFRQGRAALLEALDAGVNCIHSSYEYGTRWALSEILKDHPRRHEIHHIIKAPVPEYEDSEFSTAYFQGLIETGLKELHTERIAVVQHLQRGVPKDIIYDKRGDVGRLKNFEATTARLRDAFEALQRDGKVGYLASFPHTLGFADRVVSDERFDGMVSFYNPVETDLETLFPRMRGRMGFFAMRPFLQGLLSDKRRNVGAMRKDPYFGTPAWQPHLDRLEIVLKELEPLGMPLEELALRFALTPEIVSSVIVSLNDPTQVKTALSMAEKGRLDPGLVSQICEAHAHISLE